MSPSDPPAPSRDRPEAAGAAGRALMSASPLARMVQPPELEFELLAEIATGPTARVELCMLAAPPELEGQFCAVKRLYPHIAEDPQFSSMFADEIWMTALLQHPNVVRVIGWGNDAHGMYLAVELVQGVSLARLMKTVFETREAFTERMVVSVGAQICAGLGAAHALASPEGEPLGLVHRDLTPGNVLLGFDGQVKIADFGLAKAKQRLTKTLTGLLKGHPHYMAPEQAGDDGIDGRADLFSLGVVLFEMFSGRHPWTGATELEVLHAMAHQPPADLLALRPRIDRELVLVVSGLLERDPQKRFRTADEVRVRLLSWLDVHGYREEGDDSIARFVRRNAMRQMRWFERAAQGELRLEAERARARLSGIKRARTQTRDGARVSSRRRAKSKTEEATEVSSAVPGRKSQDRLASTTPEGAHAGTASGEFSEETPTVVKPKHRSLGVALPRPVLDEDSDQKATGVKPTAPVVALLKRLPPPRVGRFPLPPSTESAPTRPRQDAASLSFSLPGDTTEDEKRLGASQDTLQDFPTLDDPESEELPTHPLRSIPHAALAALGQQSRQNSLGDVEFGGSALTDRLQRQNARAREEAERTAKLAAKRSVIAQLWEDALGLALEAERLSATDTSAASSLWAEARRLEETAKKGESALSDGDRAAGSSQRPPAPAENAVSAMTPPHFPSAPPPPSYGLPSTPSPGNHDGFHDPFGGHEMGQRGSIPSPELRVSALPPTGSVPPPPASFAAEVKLLLAGEVFGVPVPVALGIAFGLALVLVVLTALLVG